MGDHLISARVGKESRIIDIETGDIALRSRRRVMCETHRALSFGLEIAIYQCKTLQEPKRNSRGNQHPSDWLREPSLGSGDNRYKLLIVSPIT